METRKIYYEDSHCREFEAEVVSCEEGKNGFQVVLDATAFYPEGGGQACDLGTLGDARVRDVRERDGVPVHLCDRALPVGSRVTGKIDWARRLDLMQQHTGEHIVSGILHKMFGCHNVGFHMGAETVTIDFDVWIPQEALAQAEEEANRAVYENLPVRCWYPEEEALSSLPYRTKKQLPWPVRIVEVPGYDMCACCGVHVKRTGEIGLIKLLSCVKFHEGVRIEMLCGARAFKFLSEVYEQNRQVSQAFSAKILETGGAARRMNDALAEEKFRSIGMQKQLFDFIAEDCRQKNESLYFGEGLQPTQVRELADRIARICGQGAVLSGDDTKGYQVCLAGDVAQAGKALTQTLGGRGGGKPGFFQGSIPATREQILHFFENWGKE